MSFLSDLFSDLVEIVDRNLSLNQEDSLKLQEIKTNFEELGSKIVASTDRAVDEIGDLLEAKFTELREHFEQRFEEKFSDLRDDVDKQVNEAIDSQQTTEEPKTETADTSGPKRKSTKS